MPTVAPGRLVVVTSRAPGALEVSPANGSAVTAPAGAVPQQVTGDHEIPEIVVTADEPEMRVPAVFSHANPVATVTPCGGKKLDVT